MMGKYVAKESEVNRSFKPQVYKINEEDKVETFMTHTTMTGGTIKIGIAQTVGIEEFN